jgi:predicted metalloprotease with PDZ domain
MPKIHYQVSMPQPHNHLFNVQMTVTGHEESTAQLKMAVWTPGSYLIREYSRHVQDFSAVAEDGTELAFQKTKKNTWKITTEGKKAFTVSYNVYAFELTVRTAYLDGDHGFYNGACLFLFLDGHQDLPVTIDIKPFKNWKVSTPLEKEEKSGFYFASDFDELVDSPVECGTHTIDHFESFDTPHEVAIFGEGNFDRQQIVKDLQKIVETQGAFFGGLPYDRYVFIIHFVDGKGGGLEHKKCNVSIYPAHKMRKREDYLGFLNLESHEYFHTWNVKRLRPAPLGPFDYENENYTKNLWLSEGWTSYYQYLFLTRAGLMKGKEVLKMLGKLLEKVLTVPGRFKQSATESSFDAWIKLYRRDENTVNTTISYYSRGALNGALGLDFWLRKETENKKSLDDILLFLWENYGAKDKGVPEDQLLPMMSKAIGIDLSAFYEKYIAGTEDIPLDWFEFAGLKVEEKHSVEPEDKERKIPFIGWLLEEKGTKLKAKSILSDSPAEKAGIYANDELLAIDGYRITKDNVNNRLLDFKIDDAVTVSLFRDDCLREVKVTLEAAPPDKYKVKPLKEPSEQAKTIFKDIFGLELPEEEKKEE